MIHIPVLQKEVIQYLDPKPNENFIDCTLGGAGHTLEILKKTAPSGKVLAIDADPEFIEITKKKINDVECKKRAILVCDNFSNLKKITEKEKFKKVNGILFDLGMSSWHLEKSKRGFSFLKKEPLDMRYSLQNPLTAEKILNYWSASEIEKILYEFSQEFFAKEIAKNIIEFRKIKPIKTTSLLVELIKRSVPKKLHHKKIHPATKTFQALRIAVNGELDNLKIVLPQALEVLSSGGRIVFISFHSLEDKIIKNFFSEISKAENEKEIKFKILTKKPIVPSFKEIKINPRSRSAKLRAGQKI